MNIVVVSLPLGIKYGVNYGGIMQNYALQKLLRDMGHNVKHLKYDHGTVYNRLMSSVWWFKRHGIIPSSNKNIPSLKELLFIRENTDRFVRENIFFTKPAAGHKLKKLNAEAYIVGSDQVWRKLKPRYFLDFVPAKSKALRIAYAASFGSDEWKLSAEQTKHFAKLAKKFNAISVREESGIDMCRKYFGVEAEHTLDPTMMLDKNDYIDLVNKKGIEQKKQPAMVYVLDNTERSKSITSKIMNHFPALSKNTVMPKSKFLLNIDLRDVKYPPVEEWIRGFMDAEYVITDSFHGTVFAILFNKPFISICNHARGAARFHSLLKTFGLEDRLVFEEENITEELIRKDIDFDKVNSILETERAKSRAFLEKALS